MPVHKIVIFFFTTITSSHRSVLKLVSYDQLTPHTGLVNSLRNRNVRPEEAPFLDMKFFFMSKEK